MFIGFDNDNMNREILITFGAKIICWQTTPNLWLCHEFRQTPFLVDPRLVD